MGIKTEFQNKDLATIASAVASPFVDTSAKISVPNTAIVNRAKILDPSKDLSARMGIERIMVQSIAEIQDEFGPNGERVFAATNDDRGMIRFVGSWINYVSTDNPASPITYSSGDYIEITFYGTALNLMVLLDPTARDIRATVDGGSESGNLTPATYSAALSGRFYQHNKSITVASNLTLGVHTVKIRLASGPNMLPSGFEVINAASTITVTQGTALANGKGLVLPATATTAYNSGFESGTLGTRGGRVVVYLKEDGTIGKAVTPAGSQLNLTSANHSNEEVSRRYSFREFGSGRTDDFGSDASSSVSRAFTLADGTTSMAASAVVIGKFGAQSHPGIGFSGTGSFLTLTFVGTGLDVLDISGSSASTSPFYTVTVDGVSVGQYNQSPNTKIRKIVSGLPYGTHTVRITSGSVAVNDLVFGDFIVYQPKKPSIPAGAIEIADYNVMANYVANSTISTTAIGTGTLRKASIREMVYVGSNWLAGPDVPNDVTGWRVETNGNGDYVEYSFFGTGVEFRFYGLSTNGTTSATISIDGSSNLSGFTTSSYGATSFNSSTGVFSQTTTSVGAGISISGLTLGLHKIRITNNATSYLRIGAFDIITPIHSAKSDLNAVAQNTLPVGSCAISNNLRVSNISNAGKAWAQAVGITSSPTTTSTALVPMPDMSVTIKTNGGALYIQYSAYVSNAQSGGATQIRVFVNGIAAGVVSWRQEATGTQGGTISGNVRIPANAGFHKVDLYWAATVNTSTAYSTDRILTVSEQ